jgi:hypothetical protein
MSFFTLNKKNIGILALVATIVLVVPSLVLGATPDSTPESGWLESILWRFVVGVFGTLVYIAGQLLNVAVETYTIGFGNQFIDLGLGFAVNNLWETVRDIFNLTFIFGLVYIGFKMILNTGDTNARRMLVHIILAALLVNFSLFFTKFVIDFSNVAAAQVAQGFYKAGVPDGESHYQVSDQFLHVVGFTSIFKDNLEGAQNLSQGKASGFTYIFFTMVMLIIMAFVFFAGAILLMIRFVVLNLYMILSPIMFLGWVFPALSSYSEKYWSGFLSRAFFAPAYLLMLYFAFIIMQQYAGLIKNGGASFQQLFTGTSETTLAHTFATTVPFFAMICIFLIASVVVAQKMSMDGASWVTGFSKKVTMGGVRMVTYPVRAGARVGANATGAYTEKKFNNLQARGGKLGTAAKWNWIDRKARAATGGLKGAELGTGTTNQKEKEYKQATEARASQTTGENTRNDQMKEIDGILKNNNATDKELAKALEDLSRTLRQMSSVEKERLGFSKLNTQSIATNLSDTDLENFEKSGKFSAQQIQEIKNTRNAGFNNIATHGNIFGSGKDATTGALAYTHTNAHTVDSRPNLFNKSVKDLGKLPIEIFKDQNMYTHITPAMIEERMRNTGISTQDKADMKQALSTYRTTASASSNNLWDKWENGNSTYAAQFFA